MITPEPSSNIWSLAATTSTTAFSTAAATLANPDSGGWAALRFGSVTFEFVNASATSVVFGRSHRR
jgi:hypothetical protein